MSEQEHRQYRQGVLFVAGSAVAWSSSGLFIRWISADLMTILFWRGIISGAAVFALFFFLEGRKAWPILKGMRGPSIWAAVLSTAAMITGIGSMYYGSIADSMVIYATGPFITALVAFLAIGERPNRATVIASVMALAGVVVMLSGVSGGSSPPGILLAVLMTLTASGLAVIMRHHRDVPMLPAMATSAWLCSFSTFWFADPMHVGTQDFLLIIGFGLVQNALGLILYTWGAWRIPAADASLVISLEVPLTPLWVWLVLGEMPSRATLVGGSVVMIALFGHILYEMRRQRGIAVIPPLP